MTSISAHSNGLAKACRFYSNQKEKESTLEQGVKLEIWVFEEIPSPGQPQAPSSPLFMRKPNLGSYRSPRSAWLAPDVV